MDNNKEMYYHLMRAAEAAIRLLIQTQQECEELYLSADASPFPVGADDPVRPVTSSDVTLR